MGSKIPEAKLSNGERLTALEYEEYPRGKVFCCSGECGTELSYVRRHNRKYERKTIEVAPCFRLKRHNLHAAGCKYNIEGLLELIAKSSKSEIFGAISKAKYEFRLHILLKALHVLDEAKIRKLASMWGGSLDLNKNYGNKGRLKNYLRTLRQILELKNYCESDEQLSSLVTLNYHGTKVRWLDFYYNEKNLPALVSTYGTGEIKIPLAIAGHIFSVKKLGEIRSAVDLYSPTVVRDAEGNRHQTTAQIYIDAADVASMIKPDSEYIFFGLWSVSIHRSSGEGAGGGIRYQNVRMHIKNADHFIEI